MIIRHIVKLQNITEKEKNLIKIRKKEQIFLGRNYSYINNKVYYRLERVKKYAQLLFENNCNKGRNLFFER